MRQMPHWFCTPLRLFLLSCYCEVGTTQLRNEHESMNYQTTGFASQFVRDLVPLVCLAAIESHHVSLFGFRKLADPIESVP